jgi:hypothetical protein
MAMVLLWAQHATACEPVYLPAFADAVGCERIASTETGASATATKLGLSGDEVNRIERSVVAAPTNVRPPALAPLYASFVTLQALDAHSTIRAAQVGAEERNPLLAPFVDRPMAVVALKAATTTGAILLTEKLWRRHRVAAIALMIGINGAYAAIVANNYRVRR